MRSANIIACVLVALICIPALSLSQETAEDVELTPEQIIKEFSEKESEFFEAWMGYSYTQTAVIKVVSVDYVPVNNESMMLVSEVIFNEDGTRDIRPLERRGRLRSIRFTPEDEDIIYNLNPFALTSKDLPLYNLKYRGKERVDELDCYVFSVKPKNTKGDRLYFKGEIWVDDIDLQVVRTLGRAVPETNDNKFPEFETLRQVIDGKYWFPVYTHASETLRFPGQDVEIEETITYEGYREFGSKTKVRYGDKNSSEDSSE